MSSPADLCHRQIQLGSRHIGVAFPFDLSEWFDGLTKATTGTTPEIELDRVAGGFAVTTPQDGSSAGLGLGEALALFWERVSYALVDATDNGLALHAAAVRRGGDAIAILGDSGAGKTHLAHWYAGRGFDIGTDEITVFAPDADGAAPLKLSTLARPLILKQSAELAGDDPSEPFFGGRVVAPGSVRGWGDVHVDKALLIIAKFSAGASLDLRLLTPGETGLAILGHCLNVRNLRGGGLGLAAALGREVPAIAVTYGGSGQLEGTLDVLTRQVFASPVPRRDLEALCRAFSVPTPVAPGSTAAATPAAAVLRPVPEQTTQRFPRRLTIGLATYDDYDGAYFTVQGIRLGNPGVMNDLEFVIIDNNPGGQCSQALADLAKSFDGCRYVPRGAWSGTAIRNAVFEEASSPFVLCVDSHVLLDPGAVARLIDYFETNPDTLDLLQGPMHHDSLRDVYTHMDPQWRGGMYGTWGIDERGRDPNGVPFEIPLHGLGLFAARRAAWPGFSPDFRGFGGEEGYIQEKIRQRGGRTLCLPFLRWLHRFQRPMGTPYKNRWEDRIRNYVIGFTEIGWDRAPLEEHFKTLLGAEPATRIFAAIYEELAAAVASAEPGISGVVGAK